MRVTLVYDLPDELEAYQIALKIKNKGLGITPEPTEDYLAFKELREAVTNYLLRPKHDELMALNKVLDKYY